MNRARHVTLCSAVTLSTFVLLLTGCTAGGAASDNTLTILDEYTTEPASPTIDKLIEEYKQAHPGVEVVRTSVPQGQGATKLTQGVAAGSPPDVVFYDSPNTQQYASQGLIESIDEKMQGWETRSEYFDGAWESTQYEGSTYAVPLYSDAPGIYVNDDLLSAAGVDAPPRTWSELADAARATTKEGVSGLCFGTTPGAAADYLFMPYIWQTGIDLADFADAATPSLEFFSDLSTAESIPQDVLNWTWQDAFTAFQNQSCAMVYGGPWNAGAAAELPFPVSAAAPPQKDDGEKASVLGGYNVAAGKGGDLDKAWEFIDFFTQKENLGTYLEATSQLPNRADLADLPFVQESPFLPAFVESVSIGKPRTFGAALPQIDNAVMAMYQSVIAGSSTVEDAAQQGSAAITPLLAQ